MAFAPDGRKLLIGYGGDAYTVVLYDLATRQASASYPGYTWGTFVRLDDEESLALADGHRLDFVKRGRPGGRSDGRIVVSEAKRLMTIRFSADDRYVALGTMAGESEELAVWDLPQRKRLWTKAVEPLPHAFGFSWDALDFSADGHVLGWARGREITLFDAQTGAVLERASLPRVLVKEEADRTGAEAPPFVP